MTEKQGEKLIQLIKDLISIQKNKNGGNNYTNRQDTPSPNNSGNNSGSIESKVLDNMLANNAAIQKATKTMLDAQEKLLKIESENTKQQSNQLEYIQKITNLKKLSNTDTSKMNKTELAFHNKMVKQAELELKQHIKKVGQTNKLSKAEKDLAKIKEKFIKDNEAAIKREIELEKQKYKKIKEEEEKKEKRALIKGKIKEKFESIAANALRGVFGWGKKILNNALEQDNVMSKLSANYALSSQESLKLKMNLGEAAIITNIIGVDVEQLVKMQSSYTDEIGRSVMLSKSGLISLSRMGVATGIGAEGAAKMAAEMELFGYGAESTALSVEKLMLKSRKNGVSSSVMTKKMQENLKIANSYTFKNGLKGVQDMTIYSTKFRVNMQSIAGFADKISNPEGAIQAAANLQVLGGSFASVADPMKLLSQGINDMEGLTETYVKMIEGIGKIDKKTGEITIGGYDRLKLKAAAEATGISFDEMMTTARTKAKREAISADINLNPTIKGDEEAKDLIASLAQFNQKTKKFEVQVGGKTVSVASLSKQDIQALQPKDDSLNLKTIAENTLGLKEIIENGIKSAEQALINKSFATMESIGNKALDTINQVAGLLSGNGADKAMAHGGKMAAKLGGAYGKYALKKNAKPIMKVVGKNALKMGIKSIPIIGSFADVGFAISDAIKGDWTGAGYNALAGAAGLVDLLVPGLGTVLSTAVDVANMSRQISNAEAVEDVIIPSKGKPVRLDSKDDVFAAKPGGAISQVIAAPNNPKGIFDGVAQSESSVYGRNSNSGSLNLNIQGSINLTGGGTSTKLPINELLKDKHFVRELTRVIGNQMVRDNNGGKFAGGLNSNSF